MTKLEKLLYRKASTEKLMGIWNKGIKIYSDYVFELKAVANDKSKSKLERAEAKKNIHESDIPLKHYITSWKLAEREYFNYIIPEIEKTATEEEQKNIEFEDSKKLMEDLAHIEIFGSHSKMPDNVELVEVNSDLQTHINLLKDMIESTSALIQTEKDTYILSKLNINLFTLNLKLISNLKRLSERTEYYYNQFKPKYDKEMKEADKYLEPMLERAREIIKLGVDIKLGFLLEEYEKNKEDREKVWLFYTALKARLKRIGKEMNRNKGQFKGKMHLAKDII